MRLKSTYAIFKQRLCRLLKQALRVHPFITNTFMGRRYLAPNFDVGYLPPPSRENPL
jgi:S-adenosylmethionine:diacylglycerol 3-amino-3-carboxypropyl transferase